MKKYILIDVKVIVGLFISIYFLIMLNKSASKNLTINTSG